MKRQDSRTLPIPVLNERRRRAVKLRLGGMKLADVSAQTELSPTTIIAACKAHAAGGWKAVAVRRRGRSVGDGRRLTAQQESEIQRLIRERTPDQLKMPFALWSRGAVRELMYARFGIDVPVRTVGHYLKRWGYTPQKPIKRAYEQRPAEVRRWLDEDYPAIARRAKAEGAEIHWGDETGLRSDDVRGRGQTPVIRVNQRRENVSLISTVTNQGKVRWMVLNGAMNTDKMVAFLKRLIKDAQRKVFLIVDNLRVHHAKLVKAWLAEHVDQIEVFYLPSYSPELNPDECLNADLKAAVTTQAPVRRKGQLKKTTMAQLHRSPARVRKYFEHRPVRYAA